LRTPGREPTGLCDPLKHSRHRQPLCNR
jgi:hypothetical protein